MNAEARHHFGTLLMVVGAMVMVSVFPTWAASLVLAGPWVYTCLFLGGRGGDDAFVNEISLYLLVAGARNQHYLQLWRRAA